MPSPATRRYKRLKARARAEGLDVPALIHGADLPEAIVILATAVGMPFPMNALDYDTPLEVLFKQTNQYGLASGIDPY